MEESAGHNNESLTKPMSEQEYINKAIKANQDISKGDVIEHEDLRTESENW